MSPKVVGDRIRQARLHAGMTQSQLARAIDTSERNVVRWEGGHNAPRVEYLVAIAKATGHDTSFFLTDDETTTDDEEEDHAVITELVLALKPLVRLLNRAASA